jgi:hypothetical protein
MKSRHGALPAITAVSLASIVSLPLGANAAEKYEMHAYTNRPSGPDVIAGDYDQAIAAATSLSASPDLIDRLVANTNLCVAYTLTAVFDKAVPACDDALVLAKRADGPSSGTIHESTATMKALTNRGVLRALSGDSIGAARDFRKAVAMAGRSETPRENLEHLESTPAYQVAQAATK